MLIDITQSEINAFFALLDRQPSTSPELLTLAMKLREVASNPVTEGVKRLISLKTRLIIIPGHWFLSCQCL
jgi:hypothetical protein